MKFKFRPIIDYLGNLIQIQLFLLLVALPVLVWWGLPISLLSIPGNLFFGPWLIIFLGIACVIFFLELFKLPNSWPIQILEKLCHLWVKTTPHNPQEYLYHFPKNTWIWFIIVLIATIYLFTHLKLHLLQRLLLLTGSVWLACLIAKLPFWIDRTPLELIHRRSKIFITQLPDNYLVIHDYGTLNHPLGAESWICFQLVPTIVRKFGTTKVKFLHLHRSGPAVARNLKILQDNLLISNIESPT